MAIKTLILASALAFGGTAVAQDMTTQPAPAGTQMQQPDTGTPVAGNTTPIGGLQPANPPMAMQPAPGQQVVFQAAPSPSQAFPPPAPLKSYPMCKKNQYDGCRQRGS